jgi:Holliday junction resolvase
LIDGRTPASGLRRLPREHEELDSLDLYARIVEQSSQPINDTKRVEEAFRRMQAGAEVSLSRTSTHHGWRTQNLFEAVVASLGLVRLLKAEDAGSVFFSGADVAIPDFRIVTADGRQLLVEVKNFYHRRPDGKFKIRRDDLTRLSNYAEFLPGHELMIAVYWAVWNLWTLIPVRGLLDRPGRNVTIGFPEAVMVNHMSLLGDHTIATEWPIAFRLFDDRPIDQREPNHRLGDEESFVFHVSRAEITVAGSPVHDPTEQAIVFRLMLGGGWSEDTEVTRHKDGSVASIGFTYTPTGDEDSLHEQSFALHRPMSSIFSSMFNEATVNDEGEVTNMRVVVDPGELSRLVPAGYVGEALRIWKFHMTPNLS